MLLYSGVSFLINLQTQVYIFIHWLHIFCMGEVPVKVIQFQLFFIYFSFIDLISSYKSKPEIKELAIFDHCYHTSIFWWYNLFLTGRYLYKTHGWYFFFLTLIRLGFLKGVFSRNGERVNLTPTPHPLIFQEELI